MTGVTSEAVNANPFRAPDVILQLRIHVVPLLFPDFAGSGQAFHWSKIWVLVLWYRRILLLMDSFGSGLNVVVFGFFCW